MLNKKIFGILTTCCLSGLILIALIGCSEKIVNENNQGNVAISLSTKISGAELSEMADVFLLSVEAEDISVPIVIPLTLEDSILVGQIIVPVGLNRHFIISAYDLTPTLIYQGDDYADVVADSTVTVSIDLHPVVPMMKVLPRVNSVIMGESFVVDIYLYNAPDVKSASFDFGFLTNDNLVNLFEARLGDGLPADARISYEGTSGLVTIWIDLANLSGNLVDSAGNAHLTRLYFNSHSDTIRDFDTASLVITPIELNRGNSDVIDLFPLDSLYLENTEYELYRDLTGQ